MTARPPGNRSRGDGDAQLGARARGAADVDRPSSPGRSCRAVDCASSDDTVAIARRDGACRRSPWSRTLASGGDATAGCSRYVEPVTALLNPDVELLDDSLLALSRGDALEPPERLLAPLVLIADGSRQDTVHPRPDSPPTGCVRWSGPGSRRGALACRSRRGVSIARAASAGRSGARSSPAPRRCARSARSTSGSSCTARISTSACAAASGDRDLVLAVGARRASPRALERGVRRRAVRAARSRAPRRRLAPARADGGRIARRRRQALTFASRILAKRLLRPPACARAPPAEGAAARAASRWTTERGPRRAARRALRRRAGLLVAVRSRRCSALRRTAALALVGRLRPHARAAPVPPARHARRSRRPAALRGEQFGVSVNRLFNDGTYTPQQIDSQLSALRGDRRDDRPQRCAVGGDRARAAGGRRAPLRLGL